MERTVYSCKEFESVEVPLDALIVNGQVSVYPEAARRGFFDIDFQDGKLVVRAKSYIGLIPINDRVAIHVIPRFSIENLLHILQKADPQIHSVSGHIRQYSTWEGSIDNPGAIFGEQLLEQLRRVQRGGLLRRYVSTVADASLEGDIQLTPTVARYFSQGVRYKHVRGVTTLSTDLPENRLIKSALSKLAGYYSRRTDKRSRERAKDAKDLLTLFDRVPQPQTRQRHLRLELPNYVQRLPNAHRHYASLLWLAYLIEERKGVLLEKVGPVAFDTFVVSLADLFESYVFNLTRENVNTICPGARVEDGNKKPAKLFAQGQATIVKPDVYVTLDGKTVAIMDAKYKQKLTEDDRYVALAYCDALALNKAVLVSPGTADSEGITLLGVTKSGRELYHLKINIGASDMPEAERRFTACVKSVI